MCVTYVSVRVCVHMCVCVSMCGRALVCVYECGNCGYYEEQRERDNGCI